MIDNNNEIRNKLSEIPKIPTTLKQKIVFKDRKMIIFEKKGTVCRYYGDLMYVTFDKPYCRLHFAGNTKYCTEVNLQHIMDNLPKAVYIKCKRSAIVNVCYCKELKSNPPMVVMEDGMEIKLSKRNVPVFKQMMNDLPRISPPCPSCYTCRNENCINRVLFCRQKIVE